MAAAMNQVADGYTKGTISKPTQNDESYDDLHMSPVSPDTLFPQLTFTEWPRFPNQVTPY